jgi:DNA polymerase epsilon subunit 1
MSVLCADLETADTGTKDYKKEPRYYQNDGCSIAAIDVAKKIKISSFTILSTNAFWTRFMDTSCGKALHGNGCTTIIQMARSLVEQFGRPLELDTDGIRCMLPGIFPENFRFKLSSGKSIAFSHPCTALNHLVHDRFTNHQYHDFDPETGDYKIRSETVPTGPRYFHYQRKRTNS